MNIRPYSPADSSAVCKMLSNHIDYTPEQEPSNDNDENVDFFREVYVDEKNSGINYVLYSVDDNTILGFLGAEKRSFPNGAMCWYITTLFIADSTEADTHAIDMVKAFAGSIHDTDELCANVFPSATAVIDFWTRNGFIPNPDRSVFSNTEGQTLVAYWKRISS